MLGLITLDFGNSNPHAGLFQKSQNQWELIKVVPLSELYLYLSQLGMSAHNTSVAVCEVRAREEEITKLQENGFFITRMKDYWRGVKFAGMPVSYAKTLGEDRLIEAFYCYKKMKTRSLLIDAGTYVTMDVVTDSGFQGGYIIPGIKTYFETFSRGEQLKEVSLHETMTQKLPQETAEAMSLSYLAFGAMAKKLVLEHNLQTIVLTGGSHSLWESYFKDESEGLVVETHPHLLHFSLHYWFTTQIEPL